MNKLLVLAVVLAATPAFSQNEEKAHGRVKPN